MSRRCPCGLKLDFSACCGPYLSGAAAPPTAAALMRSRYTAYLEGAVDYLIATTAAEPRTTLDRDALQTYCATLRGISLIIKETTQGGPRDDTGFVTFEATLKSSNKKFVQRERSRFAREHGRWVYVDGELAT
jgi:SEC-C motif-containing protein